MNIVDIQGLSYDYLSYAENEEQPVKKRAVDDVTLRIEKGSFTAILGHNGSGKSTLAKHINALLLPSSGVILIDGKDTAKEKELWRIRQKAGMVFQNPDNQIIGASVEEDTGFGPENLGIERENIWNRVQEALSKVGMLSFRKASPNRLSGGQKQRVAIAGIVAMRPDCLVLDEPTAMLDPSGRKEVLSVLHELNRKEGVTIVLITHYMEEAVDADQIFVMDKGRLVMTGTPREVFSRAAELEAMDLDVPQVTILADRLREAGTDLPEGILTAEELADALSTRCKDTVAAVSTREENDPSAPDADAPSILELRDVSYTYSPNTAYETRALSGINLSVKEGEFLAVIGHTGSGKSTLIQLLNGLLAPTGGQILFRGENIHADGYDLRTLRTRVGLVFQYPETQLFEEDVLTDVCFGPGNQGLSPEEAQARAAEALKSVGIKEEKFGVSPFDLSGGQKRRVAIAGILAMHPEVLILDEPTAGLDPKGRDAILMEAEKLNRAGTTVILVSHSMEDVARYAKRLIVLDGGTIAIDGAPRDVFEKAESLESLGLGAPQMITCLRTLAARGIAVRPDAVTVEEAAERILALC